MAAKINKATTRNFAVPLFISFSRILLKLGSVIWFVKFVPLTTSINKLGLIVVKLLPLIICFVNDIWEDRSEWYSFEFMEVAVTGWDISRKLRQINRSLEMNLENFVTLRNELNYDILTLYGPFVTDLWENYTKFNY